MGWRCRRKGHKWLLGAHPREFIPITDICLRCGTQETTLPWGQCIGGHPLAEHYYPDGSPAPHACGGPA